MDKSRLAAFSDGFLAIVITIMVLELRPPAGTQWQALEAVAPSFAVYALSFAYLGIYWNNHHHFFHLVERVNGAMLWANLHLMFWLSLIPFATAWLGEHPRAAVPTAAYGIAMLLPGMAWSLMAAAAVRAQGPGSKLAQAMGRDLKSKLSIALYAAGIASAFASPAAADAFYIIVALMWLVPDRRVERAL
ncbi:MAG: TMEM175 family protein [Terriglobales bacterium]